MAYRRPRKASRSARRRKPKITYGRVFRTKKGKLGKYKYSNGRRVGFTKVRRYR